MLASLLSAQVCYATQKLSRIAAQLKNNRSHGFDGEYFRGMRGGIRAQYW